jgi:enoyl-CoA hydratase
MTVSVEKRGNVALITMNDGKANAFGSELVEDLIAALKEAESSRSVVITGFGKVFSAGIDVRLVQHASLENLPIFLERFDHLLKQLLSYPRPLVAACNGHAIGAGAVLLLACDHRIGLSNGGIGVNGIHIGLCFPTGAVEIIRAAAGIGGASEILLQGRRYLGDERVHLGLLHELEASEALLSRALSRAEECGQVDLEVFAALKVRLRSDALERIDQFGFADREQFVKKLQSKETHERLAEALKKLG